MINANKAKELVQAHNDAVVEQRKAQVAEFLEKVVSPAVEKTANAGGTYEVIKIPMGISYTECCAELTKAGFILGAGVQYPRVCIKW